jgi:hypothetical protein
MGGQAMFIRYGLSVMEVLDKSRGNHEYDCMKPHLPCVLPYHAPVNSHLSLQRLHFRSETMTRAQAPNCPGELMPFRALDFRARNSHAAHQAH